MRQFGSRQFGSRQFALRQFHGRVEAQPEPVRVGGVPAGMGGAAKRRRTKAKEKAVFLLMLDD